MAIFVSFATLNFAQLYDTSVGRPASEQWKNTGESPMLCVRRL